MMNKYPLWKNLILIFLLLVAIIYALPVLFGRQPAVQISSSMPGGELTQSDLSLVTGLLQNQKVQYKTASIENKAINVLFTDTDEQLRANGILKEQLQDKYLVALNLESASPKWLESMGAYPIKLGLDLRGGVHFLLQVDTDSVLQEREKNAVRDIGQELRQDKIRYTGIAPFRAGGVKIRFLNQDERDKAQPFMQDRFNSYVWTKIQESDTYQLQGELLSSAVQEMREYTVQQTIMTLKRRVNELGVAEAPVQQEGIDRISVDLPGIQDAAQAKNILGKTANLEFHLVDNQHDASEAIGGLAPPGDQMLMYEGRPVLLHDSIVLSGESITHASASFDESGRPAVNISLGGGGESLFSKITAENVGQPMATVYIEIQSHQVNLPNGETKIVYKKIKRIINIATIDSALGTNFQIMGLSSPAEAQQLSLLLRAGTLAAPVTIIEEQTVGPSMGKQNIHLGMLSLMVGMILIIVFMMLYYEVFGFIADIGLIINLLFLLALLSALGAVLTFPGIAGLVLTVGMAVDYNVLIYERIREELRKGSSIQAAIHTGYDKAFTTIVDANLVSLIVALILFALGSGPVKGFAIVLTIGLITSIISSVTYTRALVNWIYGGRRIQRLLIGIKVKAHEERAANMNEEG